MGAASPLTQTVEEIEVQDIQTKIAAQKRLIDELEEKDRRNRTVVEELTTTLDVLERERDFYFNKLREVEIHCDSLCSRDVMGTQVVADIQSILYADDVESDLEGDAD